LPADRDTAPGYAAKARRLLTPFWPLSHASIATSDVMRTY
jgi:hypothetical protein